MDDVIINKIAIINNCIDRIREEYEGYEEELEGNYTKQDSIILNLQRASEATIDLGMRLARLLKLAPPKSSKDVFVLLEGKGVIPPQLSMELQNMAGFRNIAVHDYQKINLDIVHSILKNHLKNFMDFTEIAKKLPY